MTFRLFALTAAILTMTIPVTAADPEPETRGLKKIIPVPDFRKFLGKKPFIAGPGPSVQGIRPAEGGKCAHIIVYVPSRNLDRGIEAQPQHPTTTPPSAEQIQPPMSVCPQDIRQLKRRD